jgi:hypothetical protein
VATFLKPAGPVARSDHTVNLIAFMYGHREVTRP